MQMARHSRSGLEYAIKFFVHLSTFSDEAAIYRDRSSGLGQFADQLKLPRVGISSSMLCCRALLYVFGRHLALISPFLFVT